MPYFKRFCMSLYTYFIKLSIHVDFDSIVSFRFKPGLGNFSFSLLCKLKLVCVVIIIVMMC